MNILKRLAALAGMAAALTMATAGVASAAPADDPADHDHIGGLIGDIVVVAPITDVLNGNTILNGVLNDNVLAVLGVIDAD